MKYITKREEIDGRPQRKRILPNTNEIKVTENQIIPKKSKKISTKNLNQNQNQNKSNNLHPSDNSSQSESKEVNDESCPYLGLDDVSSVVESIEEQSSQPNSPANNQSELTDVSLNVYENLYDAINHCKETSEGGYHFNDIQKYLLDHTINSTIKDIEDAIKYGEAMNKIMIIVNNDTNNHLLYPID